jgi:steroid 5-alpha reductase family enzyme
VSGIGISFLISLAVNACFFAIAARRKTDTVTDLSYSLSFASVAVALALIEAAYAPMQIAACVFVVAWAVRLGGYLFRRILRIRIDHRFDGIRESPLRFARFWLLQALTVGVVMLPTSYLLASAHVPQFGASTVGGGVVWLLGFAIEWVSDAQKSAVKSDPARKDTFVQTGLWRYSRHPNYFGEMLVWWGLFVYALPFLHGAAFLVASGPLAITLLLLFVTGIPMLERSAEAKHGDDPAYLEYRRRTSLLVPLPPRA